MRAVLIIALALALVAQAGCKPGTGAALPPVGLARVDAVRTTCEAGGGTMRALGLSVSFCQHPTHDGGSACTAAGDCEGACLARSHSCAPVRPLPGCNEVLTTNGQVVSECLQ